MENLKKGAGLRMRTQPGLPPAPPPLSMANCSFEEGGHNEQGNEPPGEDGRRAFGFSGVQGPRASMEDCLILGTAVGDGSHLWGVLDGHGGRQAADFLANALPGALRRVAADFGADLSGALPAPRVQEALEALDLQLLTTASEHGWVDGSTALLVLLRDEQLQVIQVGDSNVALCSSSEGPERTGGSATLLCALHRPEEAPEVERLAAAGVQVDRGRVLGLVVTRSFGDLDCKQAAPGGVIASPQVGWWGRRAGRAGARTGSGVRARACRLGRAGSGVPARAGCGRAAVSSRLWWSGHGQCLTAACGGGSG